MSQPISLDLPARDPRAELLARLENAPIEHAEAILSAYELLQGLHDLGVLEQLRGAVASRDKALEIIVDAAKSPESVRGMHNLITLARALGTIEPEVLEGFARSLPQAVALASAHKSPPGLWSLMKSFWNRDFRRGLLFANSILEALGKNFPPPPAP